MVAPCLTYFHLNQSQFSGEYFTFKRNWEDGKYSYVANGIYGINKTWNYSELAQEQSPGAWLGFIIGSLELIVSPNHVFSKIAKFERLPFSWRQNPIVRWHGFGLGRYMKSSNSEVSQIIITDCYHRWKSSNLQYLGFIYILLRLTVNLSICFIVLCWNFYFNIMFHIKTYFRRGYTVSTVHYLF